MESQILAGRLLGHYRVRQMTPSRQSFIPKKELLSFLNWQIKNLNTMRYLRRALESQVSVASRNFPGVVLTGPRRSGKTWLLRHLFPKAAYHLFEDLDVVDRFRRVPQGFLDGVRPPVVLDEIQNVPEVFNFVRARIDRKPRTVMPSDAAPMQRLAAAWGKGSGTHGRVDLHRHARATVASRAVAPGVQALPWQEFVTLDLA